jgi:hypothetical protein
VRLSNISHLVYIIIFKEIKGVILSRVAYTSLLFGDKIRVCSHFVVEICA